MRWPRITCTFYRSMFTTTVKTVEQTIRSHHHVVTCAYTYTNSYRNIICKLYCISIPTNVSLLVPDEIMEHTTSFISLTARQDHEVAKDILTQDITK